MRQASALHGVLAVRLDRPDPAVRRVSRAYDASCVCSRRLRSGNEPSSSVRGPPDRGGRGGPGRGNRRGGGPAGIVRGHECLAAVPGRGRPGGPVGRDGRRRRHGDRLGAALQLPVHGATVHPGCRRRRGPAERDRAAVRRDRRGAAGGGPAPARRDGRGPGARGPCPVRRQPIAGDSRFDERGPRRDPRGPARRGRTRTSVGRVRARRLRASRSSPTPGDGRPPTQPGRVRVLQRMPGDQPARWMLVQPPSAGPRPAPSAGDALPGQDRGKRRAPRQRLGDPSSRLGRAGPDADAAPRRDGGPGGPGDHVRTLRGPGAGGRGRPAERRAQVGAPPVGLARPAHPAGDDPGGGREPPAGQPPGRWRPTSERRLDRTRGRVSRPAGDQPARPVADRGGCAPAPARGVRPRRPPRPLAGQDPGAPGGRDDSTWTWPPHP